MSHTTEPPRDPERALREKVGALTPTLIPVALALFGFWQFRGFLQDDAFISLRYSMNFARGEGLVFNPGEFTEGFTNMAWTLLGGLFLKLGLPATELWQALGILSGLACVAICYRLGRGLGGQLGGFGAATLVASSTTLHAWSGSGLETAPFAALVVGSVLAHSRDRGTLAFGLLGLAQWVRPEAMLPAAAIFAARLRLLYVEGGDGHEGLPRLRRELAAYLAPTLILLLLRHGYYGAWVPNTYLVKGAASPASHLLGLKKLEKLADFGSTAFLWIPALFALAPPLLLPRWIARSSDPGKLRSHRLLGWTTACVAGLVFTGIHVYLTGGGFWKSDWDLFTALGALSDADRGWTLLSAVLGGIGVYTLIFFPRSFREHPALAPIAYIWLGYLYYYVRVGGDLLPMHRLFLPGVLMQSLLAVAGVARLLGEDGTLDRLVGEDLDTVGRAEVRGATFGLVTCLLAVPVFSSLKFSSSQGHYRTVRSALEGCHGAAGRDLQDIAVRHGFTPVVLAQDMGALPLNAPDVYFLDTIGLTDRPVASILWRFQYSPYFRYLIWNDEAARAAIHEMERELRVHLNTRDIDYTVVNVHLDNDQTAGARTAAEELDGEFFHPKMKDNTFFYRWTDSSYFRENFELTRAYEYSPVHFLVTYRRKDRPAIEG